jgi:hypothetical protein
LIEVKNLTKRYGKNTAIDNISFTIEKGKIYGFLGPNGAGKTTTMNIITGCLAASEGQVLINGSDIFENPKKAKRSLGYLPEQPPLYLDMTPFEYLKFVAEAKGVKKSDILNQVKDAMEKTKITDVQHRLIKNLSKGYKQRVGIAQAILANPETVILDEPTVGLDPIQIIEIRDLIKSLGSEHTVILSSHILSEVSTICDEIIVISHGKLVAIDTPKNLESKFSNSNITEFIIRGDKVIVENAFNKIIGIDKFTISDSSDDTVKVTVESMADDISDRVFFAMAEIHTPIIQSNKKHASLEDIFIELTDEKQQPEAIEKSDKEENENASDL